LDDWGSDEDSASDEEGLEDDSRNSSYATRAEVTFEMFEDELWPHMVTKQKNALRKITRATASDKQINVQCEFAPSVVWTEIISFIKGSANSLNTEDGSLSLEDYCAISAKMAPACANIPNGRERIYELYEKYEFLKRNLGLFDAMDVTHHIFKQLESDGYSGVTIHGFVIDEVQDFTQAQLRLFMMVAKDPNFMFMTGDTCQTIARGVGFRFEDLRSMFYHLRENDKRIQVPELTKLEVNYRTHNGILRCAGEVVNMIHHFFPNAVDKLAKDRGHFEGSPPKILSAVSHDDLAILLIGSDVAHSQIEFGAY
jgi:superfamily I DNA/RNA helicase